MTAAPRFAAVRKEQKSEKLEAFIQRCWERERAGGRDLVCRAVARDANSPVVKALLSRARGAGGADSRIDILLTDAAPGCSPEPEAEFLGDTCRRRVSRDPRLRDAHEMLLIGGAVWMGESMRRDPRKCDSYELYSASCAETAARFRRFFDRLWRRAAEAPENESADGADRNAASLAAAVLTGAATPLAVPTVH